MKRSLETSRSTNRKSIYYLLVAVFQCFETFPECVTLCSKSMYNLETLHNFYDDYFEQWPSVLLMFIPLRLSTTY